MIYIIWGAPSEGKSYVVVHLVLKRMIEAWKKERKEIHVYSNFPIMYTIPFTRFEKFYNLTAKLLKWKQIKPKTLSSFKWEDEYQFSGMNDSIIIWDEAYRIQGMSSRERMSKEQHDFIDTNEQDNNDFYVIAQHFNRLEIIMKEVSYLLNVHKTSNPFSKINDGKSGGRQGQLTPWFFSTEYYLTEDDLKLRRVSEKACYKRERIWFNKGFGMAYDTRAFRKHGEVKNPKRWSELVKAVTDFHIDIDLEKENKMMEEFIHE